MRKVIFMTMVFLLLLGMTGVYAKIIPGWDRPFDPPNYYSLTSISWADTANPSFFFRDLGWQGGTVYDYKREQQSAIYTKQIFDWLGVENNRLALMVANMVGLDEFMLNQQTNISSIQNSAGILNRGKTAADILSDYNFHSFDDYTGNIKSIKEQSAILEKAYKELSETAAKLNRQEEDQSTLTNILENTVTVNSQKQLEQDETLIDGMKQAELSKRNTLLANLAAVRAIHKKTEIEEIIGYYDSIEKSKLVIQNPYREEERDTISGYQKTEAKGLVEFK